VREVQLGYSRGMDKGETLSQVLDIVAASTGMPRDRLHPGSAIDQDLRIAGEDVTDLAEALSAQYGEWVWSWPWQRFARLDEGLSPLWPLMLVCQLVTWPVRRRFSYPSPYERLELGHIANVIGKGEWVDP